MLRERWAEGKHKSFASIAREFSISPPTAERYINKTEQEVAALNHITVYTKRKTVADDYVNIIYKMLCDKVNPEYIISYVVSQGYGGNLRTLDTYIVRIAKNNFKRAFSRGWAYKFDYPDSITPIKRNDILRYITTKNPKLKRDETIGKYIDIIKQEHEIVETLENVYNDFYSILMGKDPNRLASFINKYESSVVKGFVDGIKYDITPVMNAISSHIISGFVEGNNIKRILYGGASLGTLFKKSYIAFKFGLDSFNPSQIINITQAKDNK